MDNMYENYEALLYRNGFLSDNHVKVGCTTGYAKFRFNHIGYAGHLA
jgi:hypothetical protein